MSTPLPAREAPTPHAREGRAGVPWRGVAIESAAILAVFAVVGAVAGWVWDRWATPPDGVVFEGEWRAGLRIDGDFFVGDAGSMADGFGLIGTFVVIGLVGGLLVGTAAALRCRRAELATLASVALGGALAAFVCYRVGLLLGPSDPADAAGSVADGTMLAGSMAFEGLSPFVAWPFAALVGLAFTYFLTMPAEPED